jgi:hypothetical protein
MGAVGIAIRVMLEYEPAIGLLDVFFRRLPGHSEDSVIVDTSHGESDYSTGTEDVHLDRERQPP